MYRADVTIHALQPGPIRVVTEWAPEPGGAYPRLPPEFQLATYVDVVDPDGRMVRYVVDSSFVAGAAMPPSDTMGTSTLGGYQRVSGHAWPTGWSGPAPIPRALSGPTQRVVMIGEPHPGAARGESPYGPRDALSRERLLDEGTAGGGYPYARSREPGNMGTWGRSGWLSEDFRVPSQLAPYGRSPRDLYPERWREGDHEGEPSGGRRPQGPIMREEYGPSPVAGDGTARAFDPTRPPRTSTE